MYQLGIDPETTTDDPGFSLGTLGATMGSEGTKVWVYVQAAGAIAVNKGVEIRPGFQANVGDQGDVVHGTSLGVSAAAFTDDQYGWLQVWGLATVKAGAAISEGNALQLDASEEGDFIPATAGTPEWLGIHANADIADNATGTATLMFPVNRA